jgi:hypothetical protein
MQRGNVTEAHEPTRRIHETVEVDRLKNAQGTVAAANGDHGFDLRIFERAAELVGSVGVTPSKEPSTREYARGHTQAITSAEPREARPELPFRYGTRRRYDSDAIPRL